MFASYDCCEGISLSTAVSSDADASLSYASCEGVTLEAVERHPLERVEDLVRALDKEFSFIRGNWEERKYKLMCILERVNFSLAEVNKYLFFDASKPYTRNLMATDDKNYSLLLLCWNPGCESKIHSHPCDGCFVKTLSGCIREVQYKTTGMDIVPSTTRFFTEGQQSFMNDDLGLHKIGNPLRDTPSTSLHLYVPPFKSCLTWASAGKGKRGEAEEGKIGYFSAFGIRSPHLEGKPGLRVRLLEEIILSGKKKAVVTL